MPYAPKSPCRHPMCREFATERGYCAAHQYVRQQPGRLYDATTRKDDPAVAFGAKVHSSGRWQKIRGLFRTANPTCVDPFGVHGEYPPLMHQVHHITPLSKIFESEDHEQAYAWENLASVCSGCHARLSAMERAGQETAHLFKDKPANELNCGFA